MMMWTTRKHLHNFGPTCPEVTAAEKGGFFVPENNYENMEVIRLWDFLRVQLILYRPLL